MTSNEIDRLISPQQVRRSWFKQRQKYYYTIELIRTDRDESIIGDWNCTDKSYANITALGLTFEEAEQKANNGIISCIAGNLVFMHMKLDRLQQKKTKKK